MAKKQLIEIARRKVGEGESCFIVAELSGNHHQKFDKAVELVRAAAKAGVDAVKLQTYTPDTITVKSNKKWFVVGGEETPKSWRGKTLYDLYKKAYTPWKWHQKLKNIAEGLGLIFFSTPFDETAVDFLQNLNVPAFKIASYELVHIPLLKKVAKTKKPVILSIGLGSLEEIKIALETLKENGAKEVALLHCTNTYSKNPKIEDVNLQTIADIKNRFWVVAGFSDNNSGIEIPVMAANLGAKIVEKHLIISRSEGGPDAQFSIEPDELSIMVEKIRKAQKTKKTTGKIHYGPNSKTEEENKKYRPSIWAVSQIKRGEKLTSQNVKVRRPYFGLEPKFYEKVLGKRARIDIDAATPITFGLLN